MKELTQDSGAALELKTETRAKIGEAANDYLKDSANVGLAIGIIRGEESQILCYGTTDKPSGIPITPDSVFEIGSITKAFTGILLAEAMRRGEVKLEDSANQYLPPEGQIPAKGQKPVTLWHLVTHTSGLPRIPDNIDRKTFFSENPYSTYTVERLYEFLHRTPVRPGRQHAYSNLGMGLLGHILALAAGKDYESLVKERILIPLGMNDTSVVLSEDQQRRLALPHDKGKQVSIWDIPVMSGAGALRSTIADMQKFLAANVNPTTDDGRRTNDEKRKTTNESPNVDSVIRLPSSVDPELAESIQRSHQIETRGNPFQQNLGCWLGIGLFYLLVWGLAQLHVGRFGWAGLIPSYILILGLPIYVAIKWPRGFATMGLAWFMDRLSGTPHLMTWHNGGTGGYCSFLGFVRETRTGVIVLSNSTVSVDSLGARILAALNTSGAQ